MKKIDKKEAAKECMCIECPSYVDKGELAFCFSTKSRSRAIKVEKGCICRGCPVFYRKEFSHVYFCTRGGEPKQTTKTERKHKR
ncbi:MAG: DUF2769 domain-containing protein [Nanoarchaeota archaeon]|nr:DUF2769 domain-containing protein [Nanoarchaeota archaeon]